MAGIGGLSGYTSNSLDSIRGYGGLASGLDRDSLIEGMTSGTMSKIQQFQGKKTMLQWKQSAFQNISTKMIEFAEKYTATMTSSTNLFSSAFWGQSSAKVLGANSKCISVSGVLKNAQNLSILGVKQMAKKASYVSDAPANVSFETGEIGETMDVEQLAGKNLKIKYGGKNYTVTIPQGDDYNYDTVENIEKSLKDAFKKIDIGGGDNLADVLGIKFDGNQITFENKTGNELKITGGTATELLGLQKDGEFKEINLGEGAYTGEIDAANLIKTVDTAQTIAGKEIVFNYNGKTATIKMPSKGKLEDKGEDGTRTLLDNVKDSIQEQLDKEFGTGRVNVSLAAGKDGTLNKLSFETRKKNDAGEWVTDNTSKLSITGGDSELISKKGAFGIKRGTGNRVNMDAKLSDLGITAKNFFVNDKAIEIKEDDTVYSLMQRINQESSVEVSYQEATGRFMFTSKENGASGNIDFGSQNGPKLKKLFGLNKGTFEEGQDAVIEVKYGETDSFEITRDSNTFNLDGLAVTVKDTFGYNDKGELDGTSEAVTFDVQTDTEPIIKGIKDMVKEYNEILELVNKSVNTRPDRDYSGPLTSEQKKELSEDEVKTYEDKVKEGLLYGDADLRSLANELRFMISPADLHEMEKIGLTVSGSYTDNGKLVLDESKLKAALEEDPDKVKNLFTKTKDSAGNTTGTDGFATKLKNVMNTYVGTMGATKGILIEKAGSVKAPASVLKNALYNEIKEMDKKIFQYQGRLKMERDRYIKQFTSLESVIAQMNNQSNWLSQFGGSY